MILDGLLLSESAVRLTTDVIAGSRLLFTKSFPNKPPKVSLPATFVTAALAFLRRWYWQPSAMLASPPTICLDSNDNEPAASVRCKFKRQRGSGLSPIGRLRAGDRLSSGLQRLRKQTVMALGMRVTDGLNSKMQTIKANAGGFDSFKNSRS